MKNRDNEFKTSSFCNFDPICVAVKRTDAGVTVQDTKTGETLDYDHNEWDAFIKGVKGGEFDL